MNLFDPMEVLMDEDFNDFSSFLEAYPLKEGKQEERKKKKEDSPKFSPTSLMELFESENHEEKIQMEQVLQRTMTVKIKKNNPNNNRVRFQEDVKEHDGLSMRSQILDKLVFLYFVKQREINEIDVIVFCNYDLDHIKNLLMDIENLKARIEASVAEGCYSEPVLKGGGGQNTKLGLIHVPYLVVLGKVIGASHERLKKGKFSEEEV